MGHLKKPTTEGAPLVFTVSHFYDEIFADLTFAVSSCALVNEARSLTGAELSGGIPTLRDKSAGCQSARNTQRKRWLRLAGDTMRDPKFLLVVVIVAACATGAQSQFFDNVKNSFEKFGQSVGAWGKGASEDVRNWGKGVLDKINSFKDSAMQKFQDKLPDTVKGWIGKGDYRNANVTEMLEKMPPQAWYVMKLDNLRSLGKDNFTKLINDGKDKIPPRILDELKNMQMMNVSKDDAIAALKQASCRMGEGGQGCTIPNKVLRAYENKLGDPTKLMDSNITLLGREVVLNLSPMYLSQITDPAAIMKINEILKPCADSQSTQARCPSQIYSQRLISKNNKEIYGKVDRWTQANITDMGGVKALQPKLIPRLSAKTLLGIKPEIITIDFSPDDGRQVLRAYVRAEKVIAMDVTQAMNWTNNLGTLRKYLLSSDLPVSVRDNATLVPLLQENGKRMATEGRLPPKGSKTLVKDMLKGKSADQMTEADVTAAGILLGDAAPNVVKKLIASKALKGNNLRAIGDSFKSAGPGSLAKGQTLTAAISKDTAVSSIPPTLVRFLSMEQINSMTDADVQKYFTISLGKPWTLTEAQKSAMVSKVADKTIVPPAFRSTIPSSMFKDMSSNQLKTLAQAMPRTSAVSLKASAKVFGDKANITAADIDSNLEQTSYMSSADADKINVGEIWAVLMKINGFAVPPSMDVCRVLKNKLLTFAEKERGTKGPVEFAQTMTSGDIDNMPPCVVAALGEDAVKSISPDLKIPLLQKMGKVDQSMSITRSIRRLIITEGMKLMGDMDTIGSDVTYMLGMASIDLPPDLIAKLDADAGSEYLNIMERMVASPHIPCIDDMQADEIVKLMERVYGKVNSWESLEGRCCLLILMDTTKYSQISSDVLASCTCNPDVTGFQDYVDARQSLCEAETGIDMDDVTQQKKSEIMDKQVAAAMESLNEINARRRRKRDAQPTACDTASIGGASLLTVSDIQAMTNESVLGCIYELGQVRIEDDTKSRAVLDRIKLAKNNTLGNLTLDDMRKMQYIWSALQAGEVMTLPTLAYGAMDAAVQQLGRYWELPDGVTKELAKKTLQEWKASKDMTAQDLRTANQIICGFNSTTIEAIPVASFRDAMPTLRALMDCPDTVMQDLAKKTSSAYGETLTWDAATVSELGNIIGGLAPEKLMNIPPGSMTGLSVQGLQSIPPESIKVMKVSQIQNFPSTVAMALSDDQKKVFNSDMLAALNDILPKVGSGAQGTLASMLVCFVLTTATFLLVA
ncbi:uncharacterized protein [Macrobrachium rosenbergii]|uniref:uncharacterized protein n=1 Tax=Macrobrachium rosenbergii TaxID=79674 RepID=UPI0034D72A85